MSLTSIMPQLIDVERFTVGAIDEYGNQEATWAVVAAAVKCRLENFSGRNETERRDTVTSYWRCFVPADTDVTQDDRVIDGTRIFNVTTVEEQHRPNTGLHHLVVWLELKED